MSLLESFNASLAGQLLSFVGAGALIDFFIPEGQRDALASYVLGDRNRSFSQFEKNVITSLLDLFSYPNDCGHISPKRVLIYTCLGSSFTLLIVLIGSAVIASTSIVEVIWSILIAAMLVIPCAYVGFAGDFYSIYVSRRIFLGREYGVRLLPFLIALDLFLTLLPSIAAVGLESLAVSLTTDNLNVAWLLPFFLILVGTTMILSVLVSFVQIAILISGTFLRIATRISSALGATFGNTHLRKYPVTLSFLLSGVALLAVDQIRSLV